MEALEMETPMDNWNDDRLDELSRRMDEGFKEMRDGFARVDQRFETVATREEFGEVKGELCRVNDRLDKLMLAIFASCIGVFGTVFVGMIGLVLQA